MAISKCLEIKHFVLHSPGNREFYLAKSMVSMKKGFLYVFGVTESDFEISQQNSPKYLSNLKKKNSPPHRKNRFFFLF